MQKSLPFPAWTYRQSGTLPYRWRKDKLEVLLISSRSGKRWVAPKGIVDPGMSPAGPRRQPDTGAGSTTYACNMTL